MRNFGRTMVLAVCVWGAAWGQTGGGGDVQAIINGLGSHDSAVREAAQLELAHVSKDQLPALRRAQEVVTDPQVKARLQGRVDALALDDLLHPRPLTVNVEKGTMNDLANQINGQLGFKYVILQGGRTPPLTVHASDQPVWEILKQANQQAPFTIDERISTTAPLGQQVSIYLSPQGGGATTGPMVLIDGMAIVTQASVRPANGTVELRCFVYLDPRVRVFRGVRTIRVEKALDQDGRPLAWVKPETETAWVGFRAMPLMQAVATLTAAPGVTRIKAFRGMVLMELAETERTIAIDPAKLPIAPIDTPLGRLTVTKNAAGDYVMRMGMPENPAIPVALQVRVIGTTGRMQAFSNSESRSDVAPKDLTISAKALADWSLGDVKAFEVVIPDKTVKYTLPINLENIEVPTPLRRSPGMRGGAGR